MIKKFCNPDFGLLILRIAIGVIFIYSGWSMLANIGMIAGLFASIHLPLFMVYVVALLEVIGGLAMLLGFYTCIFGHILAIIMLFAIIFVKRHMGFQQSEIDIMLLASSLAISFVGSGMYAIRPWCDCPWCKMCDGCDWCDCGECEECLGGVCDCGVCEECKAVEEIIVSVDANMNKQENNIENCSCISCVDGVCVCTTSPDACACNCETCNGK